MEKSSHYTFTVFTATFNRGHTLHRVYESLRAQTFRDFEWLIVDDGSTDNSQELVRIWQQESNFPIRYFWQNNQGKHIAFNHGVQKARGRLFLNIDSDDAFVPEALERFDAHWATIPQNQRRRFVAVTALCTDQNGMLIGKKFPKDVVDSDSLEIFYKYRLKGDKCGFHETEILRKFPFPAIMGVNFIPESIVWHAIGRRFRTRFVNESLVIVFRGENGRSDHLSGPRKPSKQAHAYLSCYQSILNDEIAYLSYRPWHFVVSAAQYARYSFHARIRFLRQIQKLANIRARILWLILAPCGLLIYWVDKIFRR